MGAGDRISDAVSDRWRADRTLFGAPAQVLDGLEAWVDSGIKTPILVPSSANGGQMKAFEEMFALLGVDEMRREQKNLGKQDCALDF